MRKTVCVAAALVALGAPSLRAQELAELCRASFDLKVGQWSSYNVSGGQNDGQLRFAIVGSERGHDSTFMWFEIGFTSKDPNRNGTMQILIPSFATGGTSIRGLIIKTGTKPAMKMPSQLISIASQQTKQNNYAMDWRQRCASGHAVGWESVTVPAGTMRALHVKTEDGTDLWAARDIPFGVVKSINRDGSQLVLTGHGTDAKSSITEVPQEMSFPMMQKP